MFAINCCLPSLIIFQELGLVITGTLPVFNLTKDQDGKKVSVKYYFSQKDISVTLIKCSGEIFLEIDICTKDYSL